MLAWNVDVCRKWQVPMLWECCDDVSPTDVSLKESPWTFRPLDDASFAWCVSWSMCFCNRCVPFGPNTGGGLSQQLLAETWVSLGGQSHNTLHGSQHKCPAFGIFSSESITYPSAHNIMIPPPPPKIVRTETHRLVETSYNGRIVQGTQRLRTFNGGHIGRGRIDIAPLWTAPY